MACVWIEGFETHSISTQMSRKYASASGTATSKTGRVHGFGAGMQTWVAVTPPVGSGNTAVVGYGFKYDSLSSAPNGNGTGWYIESGVNEQLRVVTEYTTGLGFRFLLERGGTNVATSSYFDTQVWHYFEWKFTVRTSTNGAYELRHNGSVDISGSAVNLANSGGDGWDTFAWRTVTNYSNILFYDDVYVLDGTGTKNNDFLGPSIVEGVLPNADGATVNWTPSGGANNWDTVNESRTTGPDDSGTHGYNSSDTNTDLDLYGFEDLTQITGTIHAVQVGVQLGMASAGTRVVKNKYRDPDTTVVDGASHTVDSTVYDEFTQVFDDNPNSAVAWDVTDIDDGQFGVEVVS
jgi:hypothetical protein